LSLFKLIKYKIVVFDEAYILFHFNIILNATEYPLLRLTQPQISYIRINFIM